jgi:transcription initiation factor IIE alpha subunit
LEDALFRVQEQSVEIERINQLLYVENDELKGNIKTLTRARVMHKEIDIEEFRQIFPSPDECFKYLMDLKWKTGFKCRKCGNTKSSEGKDALAFRCTKCRYEESPTTNTVFHKVKFPINKAFEILFLVYSNKWKITSTELSDILKLRQKTCWAFMKKLESASEIWQAIPGNKKEKMDWDTLILINPSDDESIDDDK